MRSRPAHQSTARTEPKRPADASRRRCCQPRDHAAETGSPAQTQPRTPAQHHRPRRSEQAPTTKSDKSSHRGQRRQRARYHDPRMKALLPGGWSDMFAASLDQRLQPKYFGVEQLVKHALALRSRFADEELSLVYGWWEQTNADELPEVADHRSESLCERPVSRVVCDHPFEVSREHPGRHARDRSGRRRVLAGGRHLRRRLRVERGPDGGSRSATRGRPVSRLAEVLRLVHNSSDAPSPA